MLRLLSIALFVIFIVGTSIYFVFMRGANPINEAMIEKYILENPETLIKSLENYQEDSIKNQRQQANDAISQLKDEIENDPNSPFIGNPDGDIVITEFFDYYCIYCKKSLTTINELLEEDKNIKVVFKEYPIFGERSDEVAKISTAVHLLYPEKYFAFHQAVMENKIIGKNNILQEAEKQEMDSKKLAEKMESKQVADILVENSKLGDTIGIRGTPAFVISGKFSPGYKDKDDFQDIIEDIREERKEGGE